jgi:SAM-dependent methyltransferase
MTTIMLSQTSYVRPARNSTQTIIEDSPQEHTIPLSFYSATTPARTDTFDDLYDISEDEEESFDFPITFSDTPVLHRKNNSVKLDVGDAWPSVQKHRENVQLLDPRKLSPPITTPQAELSRIAKRSSVYSVYSADAPSLDDSYTSEDMSGLSCPATPDVEHRHDEERWSIPQQLGPDSMVTLDLLSINERAINNGSTAEMQEVPVGIALPYLHTANLQPATAFESGELSSLSIPSPGGFFSQLEPGARSTWLPTPKEEVHSAVAEQFYSRAFEPPFKHAPVEIIIEDTSETEGPPTARRVPPVWNSPNPSGFEAMKSPNYFAELRDYQERYEKENYQDQIQEQISANFDRTASWLMEQDEPVDEDESTTSDETIISPHLDTETEETGEKEEIFFEGFSHIQNNKRSGDAFVHRKTRTEKLRLDRKCLFNAHVNHLEGTYDIPPTPPPKPQRLTINTFIDGKPATIVEDDSEKIAIDIAKREQRALEQIQTTSWAVEATKFLNGGTLLTSPVSKTFEDATRNDFRILDLGGATTCDWSWQVAMEYPNVAVHAVCTADGPKIERKFAAPRNHKEKIVPNLWTLPYPANYFDCISARSLHSFLRTHKMPRHRGLDEYDLCMKECLRVLKPGGFLEFALLDAELLNAGRRGQALSAEFCSNLRSRGYDIAPTKSWLPRLRKLGFGHTRRAWLVLPMSQFNPRTEGSTADASHITGMVGSWAWERWMVKLQREMGRDETALLDGVVSAMEEGAKTGAAWRYLSGWAQKPF